MNNSKIEINSGANWEGLDIEIHFVNSISAEKQEEIQEKVTLWVQKGIEEGYGGGYVHDKGRDGWNKSGEWYRVWLDMGSADESALDVLEGVLSSYPTDRIRVGFEVPDDRYEPDGEAEQLFNELERLKKDNQ